MAGSDSCCGWYDGLMPTIPPLRNVLFLFRVVCFDGRENFKQFGLIVRADFCMG